MSKEMQILHDVRKVYDDILGTNLVGIYVHGSIAFGCFNWEISDIDYIVVVNDPLTPDNKRKLLKQTVFINNCAPEKGIEMSVVLKNNCLNFTHPAPYELHFSNSCLDLYHHSPQDYCNQTCLTDPDLAAHFTVIKSNGIVLYGTPIDAVFGPVDPSCYLDSIKADIKNAIQDVLTNPVYTILNLCRVLAYIQEGPVLSKPEGGRWALLHLNIPGEYHAVIQSAVSSYETACRQTIDQDLTVDFSKYMLENIFGPDQ